MKLVACWAARGLGVQGHLRLPPPHTCHGPPPLSPHPSTSPLLQIQREPANAYRTFAAKSFHPMKVLPRGLPPRVLSAISARLGATALL